jgi:hypothetical protein
MPTKDELEAQLEAAQRKIQRLERERDQRAEEAPKLRRLSHTELEKVKRHDGDLSVVLNQDK